MRNITFYDIDGGTNEVAGVVSFKGASNETIVSYYTLYFGSNSTTKISLIGTVSKIGVGVNYNYSMPQNTPLPLGATYILAYAKRPDNAEVLINNYVTAVQFSDAQSDAALNYGALIYLQVAYMLPGERRKRLLGVSTNGINVYTRDLGSLNNTSEYSARSIRYMWEVRSTASNGLSGVDRDKFAGVCVTYGSTVFFQLNGDSLADGSNIGTSLWLTGGSYASFGNYMGVGTYNINGNAALGTFEWIIRSRPSISRSTRDPLQGACVHIKDGIYLQNLEIDNRYYFSSYFSYNRESEMTYISYASIADTSLGHYHVETALEH